MTATTRTLVYEPRDCGDSIAFNRPCVAHQICKRVSKAYNQMNRGSANGDAFVDWRTKYIAVLNHYIYVPSLRARACARDPTTLLRQPRWGRWGEGEPRVISARVQAASLLTDLGTKKKKLCSTAKGAE